MHNIPFVYAHRVVLVLTFKFTNLNLQFMHIALL